MIYNGYFYPAVTWKNKPHQVESTGEIEGDCAYNFIVGNRRAGKSVGVGIFALADYLIYGYRSALIRRFDKNFKDAKSPAMQNFWMKSFPYLDEFYNVVKSDQGLQRLYPLDRIEAAHLSDHEISFKDYHALIDDKIFCYPIMLNRYDANKNNEYENVRNILYDEFIPETATSGLSDEFTAVANVVDTISRGREHALETTGVVFMANAVTKTNAFYRELEIDKVLRPDTKKIIRPDKGWSIEVVHNDVAEEEVKSSPFGRVLQSSPSGRAYLEYSQENIVKDNMDFVERLGGEMSYILNLVYDKKIYAIKLCKSAGIYYFTDDAVEENYSRTYALTKEDHGLTTYLINPVIRKELSFYRSYYDQGLMRFNSMRAKNIFLEIYSLL